MEIDNNIVDHQQRVCMLLHWIHIVLSVIDRSHAIFSLPNVMEYVILIQRIIMCEVSNDWYEHFICFFFTIHDLFWDMFESFRVISCSSMIANLSY